MGQYQLFADMIGGSLMNVLLIGGGGREHALASRLSHSPLLSQLFVSPGNPGMADLGTLIPDLWSNGADNNNVIRFCTANNIELVVIGPEAPLVDGLADVLTGAGIAVFGPSEAAAALEGSKDFARRFCARHNIPQPRFASFTSAATAKAHIREHYSNSGAVIKADGLAAGKGVIVADDMATSLAAVDLILGDKGFGDAGATIVIEDRLEGIEASLFAISDGKDAQFAGSAQDHKRAFDGDAGPNTGGMGAVSPAPALTPELQAQAWSEIVIPLIDAMAATGIPYLGFLYVGLMLTPSGPQVIEFNCRFGDPEAQVILPRLRSDLLTAMLAATAGGIAHNPLRFDTGAAVSVVMVNGGYPNAYEKGGKIDGLEDTVPDSAVFHAGTSFAADGSIIATGGRVLSVTGFGSSPQAARTKAYARVAQISWPQCFYRRDIAAG